MANTETRGPAATVYIMEANQDTCKLLQQSAKALYDWVGPNLPLKTELESHENALLYEEVRYMFECLNCGNCKIFGMVSRETNNDDVNLMNNPVHNG